MNHPSTGERIIYIWKIERIAESLGDRSLWKFVSLSLTEDTENGKKPARLKEYDLDAEFDRIEFSPDVTEGMGVPSGYGWKDAGDPDHVQVGFDEQSLLSSDSYPDVYAGSELDFRYHVIPKRMELVIAVHKLAFDLEGIDRGPEGPDLKSASPTSFSMVTGESTDIAVKLQEEGKVLSEEEFVLFLSSDRSIAWVDPIPVKRGNDGRVYASVTAKEPGTTTIKAISRDLKVVTFTVKVTKEPEIVETGKEPEETTMAPEKPTSEQPSVQDPSGSNALEVIMLGVLLGVIVLFMVIGTLILLKSARNK